MQNRYPISLYVGGGLAFFLFVFVNKFELFGQACYYIGSLSFDTFCVKPPVYWSAWALAAVLLFTAARRLGWIGVPAKDSGTADHDRPAPDSPSRRPLAAAPPPPSAFGSAAFVILAVVIMVSTAIYLVYSGKFNQGLINPQSSPPAPEAPRPASEPPPAPIPQASPPTEPAAPPPTEPAAPPQQERPTIEQPQSAQLPATGAPVPAGPPEVASVSGPSYDCATNLGRVDQAICGDADLATRDRRMAELYTRLRVSVSEQERGILVASQRLWLQQRAQCQDPGMIACISQLYDARIRELEQQLGER